MKKQFSYDLTCNKFYKDELLTILKDLKIPYFLVLRDDLLYEIKFDYDNSNIATDNTNFYGSIFDSRKRLYIGIGSGNLDLLLNSINNSHYYDNIEFLYRMYCDEKGLLDIIDFLNYDVPEDLEIEKPNGKYSITFRSKTLHWLPESSDHLQIEIINMNTYRCLRKLSNDKVEELISSMSAA